MDKKNHIVGVTSVYIWSKELKVRFILHKKTYEFALQVEISVRTKRICTLFSDI